MQRYTKGFKLTEHLSKVTPDLIKDGRAFLNMPGQLWAAAIRLSTAAETPIAKLFLDALASSKNVLCPGAPQLKHMKNTVRPKWARKEHIFTPQGLPFPVQKEQSAGMASADWFSPCRCATAAARNVPRRADRS